MIFYDLQSDSKTIPTTFFDLHDYHTIHLTFSFPDICVIITILHKSPGKPRVTGLHKSSLLYYKKGCLYAVYGCWYLFCPDHEA